MNGLHNVLEAACKAVSADASRFDDGVKPVLSNRTYVALVLWILERVTKLDDVYPYWPRWLRWCWMSIPMFPHLAETRWRDMGRFHPATLSDGELTATIDALLESIA